MRCSGDMGLAGGGAASMRTFQRSSRATIPCSTSCSTAARPRCLMVYRPPPQFRQRARSFPESSILNLMLACSSSDCEWLDSCEL